MTPKRGGHEHIFLDQLQRGQLEHLGADQLNSGRFQYTGQMWLPEIGLYYDKARLYSPTLGRFMQTDPIEYDGDGPNLYAYVLNDPVNYSDPSGLASSPCVPSAVGTVSVITITQCKPRNPPAPVPPTGVIAKNPRDLEGRKAVKPPSSPKNANQKQSQCVVLALRKNALALILDGAGVAAEFAAGPEVAAIAALGLGAAAIGNSLARKDVNAATVAYAGREAGVGF